MTNLSATTALKAPTLDDLCQAVPNIIPHCIAEGQDITRISHVPVFLSGDIHDVPNPFYTGPGK